MEITISSRQVLLPEFAWCPGLFMQAGCPDLETALFQVFLPWGSREMPAMTGSVFPKPLSW